MLKIAQNIKLPLLVMLMALICFSLWTFEFDSFKPRYLVSFKPMFRGSPFFPYASLPTSFLLGITLASIIQKQLTIRPPFFFINALAFTIINYLFFRLLKAYIYNYFLITFIPLPLFGYISFSLVGLPIYCFACYLLVKLYEPINLGFVLAIFNSILATIFLSLILVLPFKLIGISNYLLLEAIRFGIPILIIHPVMYYFVNRYFQNRN
jgi:hypothetical protein